MLSLLSLSEFCLICFQNWQSAQEKRKRKTKPKKRTTTLLLALKPPTMTWIVTLVSYSQLICHRHYDPPQTYAATRASASLVIVPPAPRAPFVSAIAKTAQAPNSTNACCLDYLMYVIHSFFSQTTHHHSGLWHVWVSG
jgi:hypothetical protein